MSIAKERGQIITFYSYKGGTGRSMALANVACLLADSGKRVLAVDWDLEAPGLHRFFCHQFKNRFPGSNLETILEGPAGLIEFFQVLKERTAIDTELTLESSARLFAEVRLEDYVLESDRPGLSLLKAGRFDETYASRVNAFRWDELYAQESNLFRFFAEELASRYDYVLIDSRTGLTDISGICTVLLPEKLVVVFTPNRQSLLGIFDVLQRVLRSAPNWGSGGISRSFRWPRGWNPMTAAASSGATSINPISKTCSKTSIRPRNAIWRTISTMCRSSTPPFTRSERSSPFWTIPRTASRWRPATGG